MKLRQAKKIMYSIDSGRPVRNTTWRKASRRYFKKDRIFEYLKVLMSTFDMWKEDIEVTYERPSR